MHDINTFVCEYSGIPLRTAEDIQIKFNCTRSSNEWKLLMKKVGYQCNIHVEAPRKQALLLDGLYLDAVTFTICVIFRWKVNAVTLTEWIIFRWKANAVTNDTVNN